MINVADIVVDPDFAQYYTVYRETGYWQSGRFVTDPEVALQYYGAVVPATEQEIVQVPEGDRTSIMMCFYSTSDKPFYLSRESSSSGLGDGEKGISDQILWENDRYKVIKIWPYLNFGYWQCIATRMAGA